MLYNLILGLEGTAANDPGLVARSVILLHGMSVNGP